MTVENHGRWEQLIDELILDEETAQSSDAWRELKAHLAGCDSCRRRYDRVSLAERMLHGGVPSLETISSSSLRRIEGAVLADASPRLSPYQRMVQWLRPRPWAYGAAAAAAVVVLLPFFVSRQPGGEEFQSRGGSTSPARAGVRAFCLDKSGVTPRCDRDSLLRLTVSNGGGFPYLFLVGLDDALALKWYAPRPPATASVAAPSGSDVPVGDAVRLGVNHDPGRVHVYALFSQTPIDARDIEAAVAQLSARGQKPPAELPLARSDVTQQSVVLDVEK
jgi:hypothetical protein